MSSIFRLLKQKRGYLVKHIKLKGISQPNIISLEISLREIGYLHHKDYKIHSAQAAACFRNGSHIDYHEDTNYHFEMYNNTMITDDRVKTMLSCYIV